MADEDDMRWDVFVGVAVHTEKDLEYKTDSDDIRYSTRYDFHPRSDFNKIEGSFDSLDRKYVDSLASDDLFSIARWIMAGLASRNVTFPLYHYSVSVEIPNIQKSLGIKLCRSIIREFDGILTNPSIMEAYYNGQMELNGNEPINCHRVFQANFDLRGEMARMRGFVDNYSVDST